MIAIRVTVERFTDGAQPGWVLCRLVDASGTHHLFEEKVPVVSRDHLAADSAYPCAAFIDCTVVGSRRADDGRELVEVDTASPWSIQSTAGATRFVVFREQLTDSNP
ncbi:hypothetical protein [Anaeromyxobacter diazotrophicus]|uniref:Uncharacterized protein n=1 Tax=Anaeromyxobacter diazotrophicus TaxID=2590199 RepID=A0A7I9VSF0_9BACT|nr:hypothetical protein [Anaeromyxobacter diazotrophicus]GEJ58847.1 hypothetical protein AMYX_35880 [Anaeromyxobacter diazotrophicus]